jgi:hypothetical protein
MDGLKAKGWKKTYQVNTNKKVGEATLISEKANTSQMPVAHTCNPSNSGGRDWEIHSLRPTQAYSSQDPISKIHKKKGWRHGSSRVPAWDPEFKLQYHQKKKKKPLKLKHWY